MGHSALAALSTRHDGGDPGTSGKRGKPRIHASFGFDIFVPPSNHVNIPAVIVRSNHEVGFAVLVVKNASQVPIIPQFHIEMRRDEVIFSGAKDRYALTRSLIAEISAQRSGKRVIVG